MRSTQPTDTRTALEHAGWGLHWELTRLAFTEAAIAALESEAKR